MNDSTKNKMAGNIKDKLGSTINDDKMQSEGKAQNQKAHSANGAKSRGSARAANRKRNNRPINSEAYDEINSFEG